MNNGVIIVAKASANCGKTTAIHSIWFYLKKCGAVELLEPECFVFGADKSEDVKAVLAYQGIRIGISSMGDPGIDQSAILDDFIKQDCRIIICACRTKGSTLDPIVALKDAWDIRYIRETASGYGFISIDQIWGELMLAIRLIKLSCK